MKPGDHPEFFRIAPPPGTSRESTIALDREGRFFHEGIRVEHPALERALHGWITKHPDDGRFILTNGYDWCYFRVEDAPFVVRALALEEGAVTLKLSDDTEEPLAPETLALSDDGVAYVRVKRGAFEARFSRHAQGQLAPLLTNADPPELTLGPRTYRFAPRR